MESEVKELRQTRWHAQSGELCVFGDGVGGWKGFPSGVSGKESICQCRRQKRRGLDHWVGKIL